MSDTDKADALDLLAETLERGGLVQDAESALGLSSGMLSTWRKNSEKIYSLAAEKLRKTLSRAALAKAAKQARYPAMETKLVADIKRDRVARAGGGGSGFQLTDAAKAEAARRAARLQPVPAAPRPAAALKQSRTLPLTATSEPKPELPDLRDFTEAEAQRFLEQRKLIGRRVHYDDTSGVIVDVEPSLDYGFLYDVKYDDKTWGQIELSEIKDALAAASTVPSAADRPAPLAAVAARRGPAAAQVAPRPQTLLSWRPSPPT